MDNTNLLEALFVEGRSTYIDHSYCWVCKRKFSKEELESNSNSKLEQEQDQSIIKVMCVRDGHPINKWVFCDSIKCEEVIEYSVLKHIVRHNFVFEGAQDLLDFTNTFNIKRSSGVIESGWVRKVGIMGQFVTLPEFDDNKKYMGYNCTNHEGVNCKFVTLDSILELNPQVVSEIRVKTGKLILKLQANKFWYLFQDIKNQLESHIEELNNKYFS
jgi:hypothetical protein